MTTMNKVAGWLYLFLTFAAAFVAGLQSMDWTAYFEPKTALMIVGGINGLAVAVKGWIASVEMAARNMTTPPVQK